MIFYPLSSDELGAISDAFRLKFDFEEGTIGVVHTKKSLHNVIDTLKAKHLTGTRYTLGNGTLQVMIKPVPQGTKLIFLAASNTAYKRAHKYLHSAFLKYKAKNPTSEIQYSGDLASSDIFRSSFRFENNGTAQLEVEELLGKHLVKVADASIFYCDVNGLKFALRFKNDTALLWIE